MKRIITYPGTPGPNNDPRPEESPMPELPERERKHIVTAYIKTGVVALALMATTWAGAQTPTTTPSTTPSSTPGQQSTTQRNQGWTMFNEDVGTRLDLNDDQLQRLQEVDNRYNDRYTGLGKTPWTDPSYKSLTDQRNADVQKILTPVQYDHWTTMYGSTVPDQMPRTQPANTGTTTPPTGSH